MDTTRHWGRVAIVTGAGSGIGRATVLRLAPEGASVIGCDASEEGLIQTRAELAELGTEADLRQADITAQADVDDLVRGLPRIDQLVNNAGVMDHFIPITEVTDDDWLRVLDVNLTGAMRMTRAVLRSMVDAKRGSVVTIGSEASLRAGAAGVAYSSSKHGLIGLVQHVAYFYGPDGVRSNAVLPGPVATSIGTTAAPRSPWAFERDEQAMATMGPPAQPDQIAAAISWLGSDEASNINGAIVTADNGWSSG
jgi:short-subunit dehydrogenase